VVLHPAQNISLKIIQIAPTSTARINKSAHPLFRFSVSSGMVVRVAVFQGGVKMDW